MGIGNRRRFRAAWTGSPLRVPTQDQNADRVPVDLDPAGGHEFALGGRIGWIDSAKRCARPLKREFRSRQMTQRK